MESIENITITEPSNTFTPAAAAAVFGVDFLDEESCRLWILRSLHSEDPRCPRCDEPIKNERSLKNFWAGKRFVCKSCNKFISATSGTLLQGAQLSYRKVFMLAVLAEFMDQGLDLQSIAGVLDISTDTVRIWRQRFKVINERR